MDGFILGKPKNDVYFFLKSVKFCNETCPTLKLENLRMSIGYKISDNGDIIRKTWVKNVLTHRNSDFQHYLHCLPRKFGPWDPIEAIYFFAQNGGAKSSKTNFSRLKSKSRESICFQKSVLVG